MNNFIIGLEFTKYDFTLSSIPLTIITSYFSDNAYSEGFSIYRCLYVNLSPFNNTLSTLALIQHINFIRYRIEHFCYLNNRSIVSIRILYFLPMGYASSPISTAIWSIEIRPDIAYFLSLF